MFSGLRLIAMVLLIVVTFLLSNLSLETCRPAGPGISMQPASAAALEEERNEAEEEEDEDEVC